MRITTISRKIKDRIVEYLAVGKLKNKLTGPILCFVGPPGVGKTSLGQSIAKAMGRKFVRLSVGGVRDEAEIRGHRRTYIGAMPGTIVRALRDAGTNNPVMMIDEIDKVGGDYRGDPQSALLEVLDPEQNNSFRDHYLDLPLDLSRVLFICTANTLDSISSAAARPHGDHLALGLHRDGEAPDRQALSRAQAEKSQRPKGNPGRHHRSRRSARSSTTTRAKPAYATSSARSAPCSARSPARSPRIRSIALASNLRTSSTTSEKPRFYNEVKKRVASVGVATGLAYTPVGGDIFFIETTAMPGTGKLTLTGQLGDVMKESATAAVSFLRSRSGRTRAGRTTTSPSTICTFTCRPAPFPKDGPSAGIAMATSIASLLTNTKVDSDLAMTGEVTLTGQVLPIGGVKEKVLGAKRAGIKKILLPKRNEMDLDDVPKEVRDAIQFSFVEELSEVFMHALGKRIITPVLLGVPEEGRRGNNVVALRPSTHKRGRPEARKRRAPVGAASRKRN
jgi:ATP-dependent Lon protease